MTTLVTSAALKPRTLSWSGERRPVIRSGHLQIILLFPAGIVEDQLSAALDHADVDRQIDGRNVVVRIGAAGHECAIRHERAERHLHETAALDQPDGADRRLAAPFRSSPRSPPKQRRPTRIVELSFPTSLPSSLDQGFNIVAGLLKSFGLLSGCSSVSVACTGPAKAPRRRAGGLPTPRRPCLGRRQDAAAHRPW